MTKYCKPEVEIMKCVGDIVTTSLYDNDAIDKKWNLGFDE